MKKETIAAIIIASSLLAILSATLGALFANDLSVPHFMAHLIATAFAASGCFMYIVSR